MICELFGHKYKGVKWITDTRRICMCIRCDKKVFFHYQGGTVAIYYTNPWKKKRKRKKKIIN